MGELPEFMMRMKLPRSSGFHSSPSGDMDYEEAWRKAVLEALPAGFEVCWPRLNEKWPVDSEGFTWVRLRCDDPKNAMAKWRDDAINATRAIAQVKALANQILGVS